MSMYDKLGASYDLMINWKSRLEKEAPFLQRLFSENRIKRVLDIGCGTGQHARLFHNWGCEVIGVDPSDKLIEIAGDGIEDGGELEFHIADFLTFPDFVAEPVDIVFCLGNTLPHIRTKRDLKKSFSNVFGALKDGGLFVFQNRNYDLLLETKERFLFPSTSRTGESEQIFFRFNDFIGNTVCFNVVHFTRVGESWIHEVYSTELQPWKHAEIESILREAGFGVIDFYGDFSGSPFDAETSSDLVGMARKI